MTPAGHAVHEQGVAPSGWLLLVPVAVAAGYLWLAHARRHDARRWDVRRTLAFLAGCLALAFGLTPAWLPYPTGDFREHMLGHLLVAMLAPLGLVLGAPVTLLLRSVPAWAGRRIGRVLNSAPVHVLAHPVTALVLSVGGMAVLYTTGLYALTTVHPPLHHGVHAHFLVSGCLFAWAIAGPDPAPRRPSVPARLVVLGVAITVHTVLSQLIYAGVAVDLPVPPEQRRGGAELMYYGGDIAELLLAFALVTTWRRTPARGDGRRAATVYPASTSGTAEP